MNMNDAFKAEAEGKICRLNTTEEHCVSGAEFVLRSMAKGKDKAYIDEQLVDRGYHKDEIFVAHCMAGQYLEDEE